jgi:ATP-dependent exoDNAse (exonuclease V) alpha subunit
MITRNDYNRKLYNGDIGVVFPDAEANGEMRVFFEDTTGEIRKFSPSRLPTHETVFAITIHKSQSSEFCAVLLILPGDDVPILRRELIYTGLTRAPTDDDDHDHLVPLQLWELKDPWRRESYWIVHKGNDCPSLSPGSR